MLLYALAFSKACYSCQLVLLGKHNSEFSVMEENRGFMKEVRDISYSVKSAYLETVQEITVR